MSVLSHPLTYADLERAREASDDRLELIEGEINVSPSPSLTHQIVVHRLAVSLDRAIVQPGLGIVLEAPFDVRFDSQNIYQPDVFAVLRDRKHLVGAKRLEGSPSLAIETISASSNAMHRKRKRNLYAQFGVPEYWVVDPEHQTVTIFSDPRDGRYSVEREVSDVANSATIPELAVDLTALFAPIWGDD